MSKPMTDERLAYLRDRAPSIVYCSHEQVSNVMVELLDEIDRLRKENEELSLALIDERSRP